MFDRFGFWTRRLADFTGTPLEGCLTSGRAAHRGRGGSDLRQMTRRQPERFFEIIESNAGQGGKVHLRARYRAGEVHALSGT
jgi:hypothetical protein